MDWIKEAEKEALRLEKIRIRNQKNKKMNTEQKHLITCTLAVYQESPENKKQELREKLKENIKNFPWHKNVQASNVFLRIIQNQ